MVALTTVDVAYGIQAMRGLVCIDILLLGILLVQIGQIHTCVLLGVICPHLLVLLDDLAHFGRGRDIVSRRRVQIPVAV